MNKKERYNRYHMHGEVSFFLSNYLPDYEQCRYLMLKVIEQATRDYYSLYNADTTSKKNAWDSAYAFIFDDNYMISWGDWKLSTEEYLDILDIDISWFREQIRKNFILKNGENNGETER